MAPLSEAKLRNQQIIDKLRTREAPRFTALVSYDGKRNLYTTVPHLDGNVSISFQAVVRVPHFPIVCCTMGSDEQDTQYQAAEGLHHRNRVSHH